MDVQLRNGHSEWYDVLSAILGIVFDGKPFLEHYKMRKNLGFWIGRFLDITWCRITQKSECEKGHIIKDNSF